MGQVSTSWGEGVVALGVVVVVVMVTVAVAVVVVVVVTVGVVVVVVTVVDWLVLRREKMPKKREKVRDFIF
jgi:Flp pilus assembly protein TadB